MEPTKQDSIRVQNLVNEIYEVEAKGEQLSKHLAENKYPDTQIWNDREEVFQKMPFLHVLLILVSHPDKRFRSIISFNTKSIYISIL